MSRHLKMLSMPKKKIPDKVFNPLKYNMNLCNDCRGLGKTFNKGELKGSLPDLREIWVDQETSLRL